MEGTPLFRPSKRRKFVRRHSSSEEEIAKPDLQAASEDGDFAQLAEKQSLSMTEILRLRQQTRSRGTGVSFSNTKTAAVEDMPEARALALIDPASDRLKAMSDRFIGHSDQVIDVDKHMMAYVDSEMAKRRTTTSQPPSRSVKGFQSSGASDSESASSDEEIPLQASTSPARATTRNPASLGQLQEVDLGPSAHQRAINQTSAALARQSNPAPPPEDTRRTRPRKPRLGRDGKPMRPRPRKRRPSIDIARDALVEQVLKENRLDIYDSSTPKDPAAQPSQSAGNRQAAGEDNADDADERLAEQFRQDFLDAMASRQQAQQAPQQQQKAFGKAKAPAGEVGQKGPKLGGSRSARAAMAQAMREKEAQAKK